MGGQRLRRQFFEVRGEVPDPEDRELRGTRRERRDRLEVVQRRPKVPSRLLHDGFDRARGKSDPFLAGHAGHVCADLRVAESGERDAEDRIPEEGRVAGEHVLVVHRKHHRLPGGLHESGDGSKPPAVGEVLGPRASLPVRKVALSRGQSGPGGSSRRAGEVVPL